MKVKIKKLSEKAVLPQYGKPGDAYMDVTATSKKIVNETDYGYIEFGTDLAFELPEGHFLDIRPRSSISNTGMMLRNSPGTLDSEYVGELKLRFWHIPESKSYEIGDRIGQIAILPIPKIEWEEVVELKETERGSGGFGSTNKN